MAETYRIQLIDSATDDRELARVMKAGQLYKPKKPDPLDRHLRHLNSHRRKPKGFG